MPPDPLTSPGFTLYIEEKPYHLSDSRRISPTIRSDYKTEGSIQELHHIEPSLIRRAFNSQYNTNNMYAATILVPVVLIIGLTHASPADTRQQTAAEAYRTYHGNDHVGKDSVYHTDTIKATHDFWTSKDGNVKAGVYAQHDRHNYGQWGRKSEQNYGIGIHGTFKGRR